jgi:hypothetical protein
VLVTLTRRVTAGSVGARDTAVASQNKAPAYFGHKRAYFGVMYIALLCAIGVLLTSAFCYRALHKPGVYRAQVDVLFLPPASNVFPNALFNAPGGLVSIAGVVGKMVDPDSQSGQVVSPTVTLANQGIRDGYSVTLPDDGGQWTRNFDRAQLNVQAVGASPTGVQQTVRRLVAAINAKLAWLQDRANVTRVNRIVTSLNPGQVQVYYEAGRRARAVLATAVLGLAITAVGAAYLRRRLRRGA